jgi:uncharacterized protein YbaR (Trm112 family)
MKINKKMLAILACPFHLDADLSEEEGGLLCKECGKIYEIIEAGGHYIPNFMLSDTNQNWNPGYRSNESRIIN